MRQFVGTMGNQRSDRPFPVPPDVERFVAQHAGPLNEIEDLLLNAAVEWKTPVGGQQANQATSHPAVCRSLAWSSWLA
jgi:hypothetical protein